MIIRLHFLGWKRAVYDEDVVLAVNDISLEQGHRAVFLATRLEDNESSNDFAWAYFLEIKALNSDISIEAIK